MNLNKQQLNAVAGEIFKGLEELRLKEIEKLTPTILKDKKLFLLKTLVEKRLSLDNERTELTKKINKIIGEMNLGNYAYDYISIEKSFIKNKTQHIPRYKLDDIKNMIILASIEQSDLAAIIEAVTTKIQNN